MFSEPQRSIFGDGTIFYHDCDIDGCGLTEKQREAVLLLRAAGPGVTLPGVGRTSRDSSYPYFVIFLDTLDF